MKLTCTGWALLFLKFLFIYLFLFIYGCVGSSFLHEGSPQLRQAGATLHRGVQASHYRGLSCCGAQAPGVQAQQLWLTGLVTPRHVASSQTRAQTHVPCIGRQTLNHCATREALEFIFVYGVRECSNFILLAVQFSQHHLLKRLSFLHCIFLPHLSKIRWPYVRGFISRFSILFHWSIFLFLCQYHAVLITVAL